MSDLGFSSLESLSCFLPQASLREEPDELPIHPLRLLMLNPVARLLEEFEAAVVAEVDAGLGELAAGGVVFRSPEQQGGHGDAGRGGGPRPGAQAGAVPVEHRADR